MTRKLKSLKDMTHVFRNQAILNFSYLKLNFACHARPLCLVAEINTVRSWKPLDARMASAWALYKAWAEVGGGLPIPPPRAGASSQPPLFSRRRDRLRVLSLPLPPRLSSLPHAFSNLQPVGREILNWCADDNLFTASGAVAKGKSLPAQVHASHMLAAAILKRARAARLYPRSGRRRAGAGTPLRSLSASCAESSVSHP